MLRELRGLFAEPFGERASREVRDAVFRVLVLGELAPDHHHRLNPGARAVLESLAEAFRREPECAPVDGRTTEVEAVVLDESGRSVRLRFEEEHACRADNDVIPVATIPRQIVDRLPKRPSSSSSASSVSCSPNWPHREDSVCASPPISQPTIRSINVAPNSAAKTSCAHPCVKGKTTPIATMKPTSPAQMRHSRRNVRLRWAFQIGAPTRQPDIAFSGRPSR